MSKLKESTSKQYKGLNKDFSPLEQPENTITFGLNVIDSSNNGEFTNLISEPGNELCYELPEGYKLIGSIYGQDGINYVFSTNNTTSRIDQVDKYCNHVNLVESDCLGFSTKHKITGEYRIRRGCEVQLYWRDSLNPDRQFNVDNPDDYQTNNDWDCNKFGLNATLEPIEISLVSVNDAGGNLPLGVYYVQPEVLDESLNVVYKGFISQPIPIYDDSINTSYDNIDGGLNIEQYLADVGGVPVTNKSFTVEFTNLPTNYKYLRLNVIRAITGDGITVDAHSVGNLQEISSETLRITYTGFNVNSGDALIDYTSLVQGVTEYNSSKVMEQVQNRLVRANMIQRSRDYSGFQQLANEITSSYVIEEIDAINQLQVGNNKNPNTYFDKIGYMGDEVYAWGIVFGFDDGESPVFHIPGRIANNNDLSDVRSSAALADVRHLGYTQADLNDTNVVIPKWTVYNTSQGNGHMAYHESNERYPTTQDCNGDYIYPIEEVNGVTVGQKIRHHRFPCRTIEPHYDHSTSKVRTLGIQFDNIQYPAGAKYHYFVRGKRDEFNKTVLDTGYMFPALELEDFKVTPRLLSKDYVGGPFLLNSSGETPLLVVANPTESKSWVFFSPKTQFYKEYLNGTHFKFNKSVFYEDYTQENCDSLPNGFDVFSDYIINPYYNNVNFTNRAYDKSVYINSLSQSNVDSFNEIVYNPSNSNDFNFIHSVDNIAINTNEEWYYYYVSNKNNNDVFNNITAIRYYRVNSNNFDLTSNNIVFGGDVTISKFQLLDIWSYSRLKDASVDFTDNLWVESEINVGLRHNGLDCNKYFDGIIDDQKLCEYTLNKVANFSVDTYTERGGICKEYYGYNKDYSRVTDNSVYFPLPITYNYCAKCLNKNPFRLIFSPKSFDIEISDTYLINQTDDFIDLPGHRGEIIGLKYKNNQLLVHTTQTTFVLQPNPQFVATDQQSAYLTTGDFLSIPPYEIQQTDLGFGGTQHILSGNNSEYGYTWIDSNNGYVYNLTNQISDVNSGMIKWLENNLQFKYKNQVKKLTGKDVSIDDNIESIGLISVYDPNFRRLIFHKRDYELTDLLKSSFVKKIPTGGTGEFSVNGVYYDDNGRWLKYQDQIVTELFLDNTDYFCDVSYTLSYSYNTGAFISFHSYMPDFMYNDESYYYTSNDNKVYQHQTEQTYLQFYDKKFPFIIEYVDNQYETNNIFALHYIAEFQKYNAQTDKFDIDGDTNYTSCIVYNSSQSTGKQLLDVNNQHTHPYQNTIMLPSFKRIYVTDGNSKIAGLFDMSSDKSINSCNCEVLKTERNLNGYIDSVPINIDFSKPQATWAYLRDKYHYVRLFYYPTEDDVKVIHHLSNINKQYSIR